MKVVLVFPPFVLYNMPSFALSSLNGSLKAGGIDSEIIYANMLFKSRLMSPVYENFSQSHSFFWLLGDYIFASRAFPEARDKHRKLEEKFEEVLANDKIVKKSLNEYTVSLDTVRIIKNQVDPFLEEITDLILAKKPDVVGFGALFQQTVASIAIAKRLKEKNSSVVTVMGGANCLEPMGTEFARIAPDIDYIFMGEAEQELYDFCCSLEKGIKPEERCITCKPVEDIDTLVQPDYTDFFAQLESMGEIKDKGKPEFPYNHLYMETNRGCNLNQYRQCSYCGFYYPAFREKSLDKVRSEIEGITKKHNVRSLTIADNVMSNKVIRKVFSTLPDKFLDTLNYSGRIDSTTFEDLSILANKCRQVISFAGVESLHDDLLASLNKQTDAAGNLRFLRDCRTLDITVCWFFLNSIPGETREHYENMAALVPLIHHLESPAYLFPVIPVRFSHYYNQPEKYGITGIKVPESFHYIFPDEADVANLPVFFDSDTPSPLDDSDFRDSFFDVVQNWINLFEKERPVLELVRREGQTEIHDTRGVSSTAYRVLDEVHKGLLEYLREPRETSEINTYLEENNVKTVYYDLVEWKYVVELSGKAVSIVTEPERGK